MELIQIILFSNGVAEIFRDDNLERRGVLTLLPKTGAQLLQICRHEKSLLLLEAMHGFQATEALTPALKAAQRRRPARASQRKLGRRAARARGEIPRLDETHDAGHVTRALPANLFEIRRDGVEL